MQTLDANNIRTAYTGGLHYAPQGTPHPTSITGALPAVWKGLGYLASEGPKRSTKKTIVEKKAWQENAVVLSDVEDADFNWVIPTIETKAELIPLAWGGSVNPATGLYTISATRLGDIYEFLFETVDKRTLKKTWQMWTGQVIEVDDQGYTSTDILGLGMTIKCRGDITVIDESMISTGGGTIPVGGTISMTVAQGTDANGNTLIVDGTVTGANGDDGVNVTIQPTSGPSESRTTSVNGMGDFTVTIPVSGIVSAGDIAVTASTLPDGNATGSTTFNYVP
jgi:hypothetical protein